MNGRYWCCLFGGGALECGAIPKSRVIHPAVITSLHLPAMLDIQSSTPQHQKAGAPTCVRLVLTAFSRTSPCHVGRNAG